MGAIGDCSNNSVAEGFSATLQAEVKRECEGPSTPFRSSRKRIPGRESARQSDWLGG
jgi:hypothetical protein